MFYQTMMSQRKFKIMNHQIEQLQEEILAKDHRLVKEHFDHHQVETSKDALKNDLTKIKKQIQSSNQIITNQVQLLSLFLLLYYNPFSL